MIYIYAKNTRIIELGRVGENGCRRVVFNVDSYLQDYETATFSILNQPPNSITAYPVADAVLAGTNLCWSVSSADIPEAGEGKCELLVMQNDVIVKSEIFRTRTLQALDDNGQPPEPWESWQEKFAKLSERAEEAIEEISNPEAEAETLESGSGATASYADGVFKFGIPTGKDGIPGVSPTVTVSDIAGGHRITITDANGAHSFDVMDGDSADAPVQDVQVNGTSVVQDGVANVPKPTDGNGVLGVVQVNSSFGIGINDPGRIYVSKSSSANVKDGTNDYKPVVPSNQHEATFYGLAKAAGDTTQSQSSNAVGNYTDEAKEAIQQMLDVPSIDDIPEVPVQDVQANGTSVVQDGVANIPNTSTTNFGVIRIGSGLYVGGNGTVAVNPATDSQIKRGVNTQNPIGAATQHTSVFYGLSKLAGADLMNSSTPVGAYPDESIDKILALLGIDDLIGPHEGATASKEYAVGDAFIHAGKLYKATAGIAQNDAIVPGTNCTQTTIIDLIRGN